MGEGREEGVGVWGQVDTCRAGFEVENGANKGRILVREPIVFLTCPGACFEVVDATNVLSPASLPSL